MGRLKSLRITLILFLFSSLITSPSASALTAAEATTLLNNCISAINDPLCTRATLPGIIGYADAAAIESAIAAGSLGVYIANGAGGLLFVGRYQLLSQLLQLGLLMQPLPRLPLIFSLENELALVRL
jgi:hypothetical protein